MATLTLNPSCGTDRMWKQKNHELIRVVDMDDRHLVNAIRLIQRRHAAAERHGLRRRWRQDDLPILVSEAERRGIQL